MQDTEHARFGLISLTNMKKMSYETYAYLRALLEIEEKTLHKNFLTACSFIPCEPPKKKEVTAREKAHAIFTKEWAKLRNMKEELHASAAFGYKDSNPALRKFWGLEET